MAETTAAVKADIEATRERLSTTLAELERKLDVMQLVRDHPWPALALALGAGFALSGSRADMKAAAAAAAATKGATSRVGDLLDDLVAGVVTNVTNTLNEKADNFVAELRGSLGVPNRGSAGTGPLDGYRHRADASATIDPEQFRNAPVTSDVAGTAPAFGENRVEGTTGGVIGRAD